MWKLKIAEGGNEPYIFSTNNFVGRQIWEFDPEAGSPEERSEVEEVRQNFYKNRYQIKPSGDLLWRMQVPLNLYCLLFISVLFLKYIRSKLYKYYGVADLKALQLCIYL